MAHKNIENIIEYIAFVWIWIIFGSHKNGGLHFTHLQMESIGDPSQKYMYSETMNSMKTNDHVTMIVKQWSTFSSITVYHNYHMTFS